MPGLLQDQIAANGCGAFEKSEEAVLKSVIAFNLWVVHDMQDVACHAGFWLSPRPANPYQFNFFLINPQYY